MNFLNFFRSVTNSGFFLQFWGEASQPKRPEAVTGRRVTPVTGRPNRKIKPQSGHFTTVWSIRWFRRKEKSPQNTRNVFFWGEYFFGETMDVAWFTKSF